MGERSIRCRVFEIEGSESVERPFPPRPARSRGRCVLYCIVPAELAARLHEPLLQHFAENARVEVVVERRASDRRSGLERRAGGGGPPSNGERRRIGAIRGRRIAERRAALVQAKTSPELPRRARRYAAQIVFVERVEPSSQRQEDLDTARLVTQFQAGDGEAYSTLYTRYYGRVYGYLRVALRNREEAEDATQDVFVKAFEALPRYEHGKRPFRHWLFTIVRNHALDQLERLARSEPMPNDELERLESGTQRSADEEAELAVFDWLTDPDLRLFVERLPALQRQVLVLRYALGFSVAEAAELMGRKPNAISALQHRALATLEERLRAVGRSPTGRSLREDRPQMRAWVKQATVLRSRRFSLM